MPIYEYRCATCDERYEELVSASATSAPPCPSCGAGGAKRLFSTFATEWMPPNVSWHNMPSKHDMGGAPDRSSTSVPRATPKSPKKGKTP
jgi:putative FmdB family regulatory protein